MSKFYVYAFLRADGTPYYVGKGSGRRQWNRRKGWAKLPVDPARNIRLLDGMTEEDAFAWEKLLIARWGRKDLGTGILRNTTDGGEGTSNPSADTLAKRSASQRRAWNAPGARAKRGAQAKARWADPVFRTKQRAATKAALSDPEVRARMSASIKAVKSTPKERERQSAAMKAAMRSPEARARMQAISRANWNNPEYCAKQDALRIELVRAKAAPFAAELGVSIDAYLAMTGHQRFRARSWKRAGLEIIPGCDLRSARTAAWLGIPADAYKAMTKHQRLVARKKRREAAA